MADFRERSGNAECPQLGLKSLNLTAESRRHGTCLAVDGQYMSGSQLAQFLTNVTLCASIVTH